MYERLCTVCRDTPATFKVRDEHYVLCVDCAQTAPVSILIQPEQEQPEKEGDDDEEPTVQGP